MGFRALEESVAAALHGRRVVLAVSGGVDSMVLMHVAAAFAAPSVAAVACFDHGTGAHATRAVSVVSLRARDLGLPFVAARARTELAGEAAWRRERWTFLRQVAQRARHDEAALAVATAHTLDDQLETVLMRVLRGSGARGLAGLYADSDIVRPFLGVTRDSIERYAEKHRIDFVTDPSNASRKYLRNRVRLDLLPALRRVDPELDRTLLDLSRRAAAARREVDDLARASPSRITGDRRTEFILGPLARLDGPGMAVVVPALAARAGVRLDRKGTALLAAFLSDRRRTRGRIQLSGGYQVEHRGDHFIIAPLPRKQPAASAELAGNLEWGAWRFEVVAEPEAGSSDADDVWRASLPALGRVTVRAWRPGDRIILNRTASQAAPGSARRVKRFLSESGVTGADRIGWPVVLVDDVIVWIPGVKRGADVARSDSPGERITYVGKRLDR